MHMQQLKCKNEMSKKNQGSTRGKVVEVWCYWKGKELITDWKKGNEDQDPTSDFEVRLSILWFWDKALVTALRDSSRSIESNVPIDLPLENTFILLLNRRVTYKRNQTLLQNRVIIMYCNSESPHEGKGQVLQRDRPQKTSDPWIQYSKTDNKNIKRKP